MSDRPQPTAGRTAAEPADLEAIAIEVANEGALVVRGSPGAIPAVGTKSSPSDVVTDLDFAVERTVMEALAAKTPGASIIGEEYDSITGDTTVGWVIDPIDGTVNLTYDLPVIGVSIAATVDGQVVAGAVVDVLRGETFSAALGTGARCDGSPIEANSVEALADSLIATGFAYGSDDRAAETEDFARLLPVARDIRCFGSAALHLCWVANGRLDGFYQRNLRVWDFAAGALIAREAGALVELPPVDNHGLLVAAGRHIFEPLLDHLR